jgi:hypothetical protein
MTLTLTVDGPRWREHLRSTLAAEPGLVPVVKGNGYGFTNARLARKAAWLGVDTIAVGTYAELPAVETRYAGDLLVLTPWRPWDQVLTGRVIHTVGRVEDLTALAATALRPRVALELRTSMLRHGLAADELPAALAVGGTRIEALSLHLPLRSGSNNLDEARALLVAARTAGWRGTTLHVSHLSAGDLTALRADHPDLTVRPRIGTGLWLGERDALGVSATVLDVHEIRRGTPFGYRGRSAPRSGHLLVVSGGTAHGIGLDAPTGDLTPRARAAVVAKGGLEALGRARSPYFLGGTQLSFAEPPHMQASMLLLPTAEAVPAVGDRLDVRVRYTATDFDEIVIAG